MEECEYSTGRQCVGAIRGLHTCRKGQASMKGKESERLDRLNGWVTRDRRSDSDE